MKDRTIAAISTPRGKGGIAVIRISGDEAISVAELMFRARSGISLTEQPSNRAVYGDILYRGEVIDDGLAVTFRAPHSYTGEDTVEISCHGGILLADKVLESAFLSGASQAEAGGIHPPRVSFRSARAVAGGGGHRPHRRAQQLADRACARHARGQAVREHRRAVQPSVRPDFEHLRRHRLPRGGAVGTR